MFRIRGSREAGSFRTALKLASRLDAAPRPSAKSRAFRRPATAAATERDSTMADAERIPGFSTLVDPRRRQARSHHRRARDADLSDHVLRVRRRRSRRLAVRPAGLRQHLYPHRQPDLRRAGRARRRARRRHRGAGGRLRPRRAGDRDARADDAGRRIHRLARSSMAARSTSSTTPSRISAGTWCGPIPTTSRSFETRGDAEDQGDLHRVRSPIRAASSPTSRRSPRSRARPACR